MVHGTVELPASYATGGITFGGSPVWTSLNALNTTGGITFGGESVLRVAGRPFVIVALPDNHTITAERVSFTMTALPDNFTLRGIP